MTKFHIYCQNQHGIWQKYLTKTNEADTFRTMTRRAKSTNRRHKITDDSGHMLDVIIPNLDLLVTQLITKNNII